MTLNFERCDNNIVIMFKRERVLFFFFFPETQTKMFLGEIAGICFKIIQWAQGGVFGK